MTMIFRRLFSACALLAVAACGGGGVSNSPFGGNAGGGGSGGSAGPTVSDLVVVLASDTVVNTRDNTIDATITALDSNRVALADVAINLSVNADAVVSTSGTKTDASGKLAARVSIGSNTTPRTITLTAASGGVTKIATLAVVQGTAGPTASDLALTLSAPTVSNGGTNTVTATVTAVDANRNAIAGIPITMQVDNGATILVSGASTNAQGRVTGQVGIGANPANRPIRVTATSGQLMRQAVVQVTGMKVTSTALPAVILPGATGKVQFKVTDSTNTPLPAFDIVVAGVGGVQTTAKTDSNGTYEYSYPAPATAQELSIRGTAGGAESIATVVVQSGPGAIPNVLAGSVLSASVRANPSVVTINAAGSNDNRAEIRALFVGANNQPIKNVRVRFDSNGDLNSIGGEYTAGKTQVYSDVNGIALTSYIPGTRFSPTDGLTVRACWDYQDFPLSDCPNAALTTITVISDALSVSIGTDNLIDVSVPLVYTQRFVVQVNDSSGLAKSDVQISPLLDLSAYRQGFWVRPGGATRWNKVETAIGCENEDVNRNGVLEIYANGLREDANGNGQLDPRKADVVISFDGASKTDVTGRVVLKMTYPRNLGSWVDYKIIVAATGVSGTEGRANFAGTLLVPISDILAEATPAFVDSPYGRTDGNPRVIVGPAFPNQPLASLCSR